MCGIYGFLLKDNLSENDIKNGIKATSKLKHRGPDNTGYWFDKNEGIFLGHTRLSILDIDERSHQPSLKQSSAMVYNGEIYNFKEIRESLMLDGKNFSTTGDTEVLHQLLSINNGHQSFNKLDGMFALAFYKNSSITLAVDNFGEKPLFWTLNDQGLYFSSEILPLIQMLNLEKDLSEEKIKEFTTYGFLKGGETFYKNLYRANPAEIINYSRGQSLKVSKFWHRPAFTFDDKNAPALNINEINLIKDEIIQSLRLRMRSDVPVGLFMSSGVDSSLLAALLKLELNRDISALTVKFNKDFIHDESNLASKIAHHIGIDHRIVDSEESQSHNSIDSLYKFYGEPMDNTTVYSISQISEIASKYFKVAISGTGGDELFFGYNKHGFLFKNDYIFKNSNIKKILKLLSFTPLSYFPKIRTAILLSSHDGMDLINALRNHPYFNEDAIKKYFQVNTMHHTNESTPLEQYINYDLDNSLPNSIIPPVDRGSMFHGLEVRSPFLSKKIYELVSSFDGFRLLKMGQKGVLKKILSDYLPTELLNPSKQGFVYPISKLIDDELKKNNYAYSNYLNEDMLKLRIPKNNLDRFLLRRMLIERHSQNFRNFKSS